MGYLQLKTGDIAPDFPMDTPWETGKFFYKNTGKNPAVLIFLRYQGCPVCQMEMARIKKNIDRFKQKNARVYVILQSQRQTVASLSDSGDWPFTIICDPDGVLFQLYGVAPGGFLKYLHPAGLVAAVKATFAGFRHGKFEGRETQLPAAFAVAPDRYIRYAYYGKTISDVPDPETLAGVI